MLYQIYFTEIFINMIYDMMFKLLSFDEIYFKKIMFRILCAYLVDIYMLILASDVVPSGGRYICLRASDVVPSGGRCICLRAGDVVHWDDCDTTTKHTIHDICFMKIL